MKPNEPEPPDSQLEVPKDSKPRTNLGEGCARPFLGAIIGAIIGTSVTILVLKTNDSRDPLSQTMAPLWGFLFGAPIGATVGFLMASIIK